LEEKKKSWPTSPDGSKVRFKNASTCLDGERKSRALSKAHGLQSKIRWKGGGGE